MQIVSMECQVLFLWEKYFNMLSTETFTQPVIG